MTPEEEMTAFRAEFKALVEKYGVSVSVEQGYYGDVESLQFTIRDQPHKIAATYAYGDFDFS